VFRIINMSSGIESETTITKELEYEGPFIDEIVEVCDGIENSTTPRTGEENLINSTMIPTTEQQQLPPRLGENDDNQEEEEEEENEEEKDRKLHAFKTSALDVEEMTLLDGAELREHTQTEERCVDTTDASINIIHNQTLTTTEDEAHSTKRSPGNKPAAMAMDIDAPAASDLDRTEFKNDHETTPEQQQQQRHPVPLQLSHRLFAKKRKIETTSTKQKSPPNSGMLDAAATATSATTAAPSIAAAAVAAAKEAGDSKRSSLKSMAYSDSQSSSHRVNTEEEKILRGSIMYKVLEKLKRLDPELVKEDDQPVSQNVSPDMDSASIAEKPMDAEGYANANNNDSATGAQPPAPVDQLKRPPSHRIAFRSTVMPQRSKQIPKESHRIVITHGVHKGKTGTKIIPLIFFFFFFRTLRASRKGYFSLSLERLCNCGT
jgi:hypothetical protein